MTFADMTPFILSMDLSTSKVHSTVGNVDFLKYYLNENRNSEYIYRTSEK